MHDLTAITRATPSAESAARIPGERGTPGAASRNCDENALGARTGDARRVLRGDGFAIVRALPAATIEAAAKLRAHASHDAALAVLAECCVGGLFRDGAEGLELVALNIARYSGVSGALALATFARELARQLGAPEVEPVVVGDEAVPPESPATCGCASRADASTSCAEFCAPGRSGVEQGSPRAALGCYAAASREGGTAANTEAR